MRTITFKRNKKGVSPIIATLLLIVIAVAAAVVTYAFVTGFIGGATKTSTVPGSMSVDSYVINSTSNMSVTAYVRNTGTKDLTLTTAGVYVDGTGFTMTINGGVANVVIHPGDVAKCYVTTTIVLTGGQSHLLKVVAADGTTVAVGVSNPT